MRIQLRHYVRDHDGALLDGSIHWERQYNSDPRTWSEDGTLTGERFYHWDRLHGPSLD